MFEVWLFQSEIFLGSCVSQIVLFLLMINVSTVENTPKFAVFIRV